MLLLLLAEEQRYSDQSFIEVLLKLILPSLLSHINCRLDAKKNSIEKIGTNKISRPINTIVLSALSLSLLLIEDDDNDDVVSFFSGGVVFLPFCCFILFRL